MLKNGSMKESRLKLNLMLVFTKQSGIETYIQAGRRKTDSHPTSWLSSQPAMQAGSHNFLTPSSCIQLQPSAAPPANVWMVKKTRSRDGAGGRVNGGGKRRESDADFSLIDTVGAFPWDCRLSYTEN